MKKIISVFLLVAATATSLAALDLSAGADINYGYHFTPTKMTNGSNWTKATTSTNVIGFNGFFDADYVRVGLGMHFTVGGFKLVTKDNDGNTNTGTNTKLSESAFRLSLLGKYPFRLGIAKIYPLLGFEFDFNMTSKHDGKDIKGMLSDDQKADLNHYYFVLGAGADIFVAGNFYITPKATFGVDMRKNSDTSKAKAAGLDISGGHLMKFEIGLGFGYKF